MIRQMQVRYYERAMRSSYRSDPQIAETALLHWTYVMAHADALAIDSLNSLPGDWNHPASKQAGSPPLRSRNFFSSGRPTIRLQRSPERSLSADPSRKP